ncbi:MAG: hypothetical protein ACXAB7_00370 [Candidatus Kariarchaeaceae archaeon]|jgi:hypothetical protein
MQKIRGLYIIIPSAIIIILELFYLIIDPLSDDQVPQIGESQYWALAIPVFFITSCIALIGVWIGYTMMVTKEPIKMTYDSAYEEAAGEIDWLETKQIE